MYVFVPIVWYKLRANTIQEIHACMECIPSIINSKSIIWNNKKHSCLSELHWIIHTTLLKWKTNKYFKIKNLAHLIRVLESSTFSFSCIIRFNQIITLENYWVQLQVQVCNHCTTFKAELLTNFLSGCNFYSDKLPNANFFCPFIYSDKLPLQLLFL